MSLLRAPRTLALATLLWGLAGLPGLVPRPTAAAAPPELNTDPFAPPSGRKGGAAPATKPSGGHQWWFIRPSVGFVERFSPDRAFLPREGFGFSFQAGAVLGQGTVRLALAVNYEYARFAREKEIYIGGTNLTSCADIRSVSHHLATASAFGWAEFERVALWFGVSGGFAYAQIKTPRATADDTCGEEGGDAPAGTVGPDFGVAYKLRRDLWLGVYLRYLHIFSKRTWESTDGTLSHRYFHPLLSTGVSVTLRF